MFKHTISILCVLLLFVSSAFAIQGEEQLINADYSAFSINARTLAMSNSGLTLSQGPFSIDSNPANAVSDKFEFSAPYLSFIVSNPSVVIKHYDEPSMWANTIQKGFAPVSEITAGVEGRFKLIELNVRLKDGIYSYADDINSAGRDSSVINVSNVRLGASLSYKYYWSWNFALAFGVQTSLDTETRTNVWNAGSLSDIIKEGMLGNFIKEGATYVSTVKFPVSAGFTLEVPYGFAVGAVVRNNSLFMAQSDVVENGSKLYEEIKNSISETFGPFKYVNNWDGDIGFSFDSSRTWYWNNKGLIISVDFVNFNSFFKAIKTWPDHIKIGVEYNHQNIALRAGWQITGPSLGLGLDFDIVKLDFAYNHVLNKKMSFNEYSPINTSQFAVSVQIGN